MRVADVRKHCARQIRELDLPDQVTVEAVCERVAAMRGRPVIILHHTLPPGSPCGLRIATPTADYLVVQASARPQHQELITFHEIGHVLFDPDEGQVLDPGLAGGLLPLVDPATVTTMLGRTRFDRKAEIRAESFATLLWGRTRRWAPGPPRVVAPGADAMVGRLERVLERGR